MVVNLDPQEGMLALPGSISAAVFSSIMDPEDGSGWGSSPSSGPSPTPVKLPLVYWYGRGGAEDDAKYYKSVVSRLALAVQGRMSADDAVRKSGIIVDTPGVVSQGKDGYALVSHMVSELNINVLLILGSERLNADLSKRFAGQLTVLKLPKSEGCVDRDAAYMTSHRLTQIRSYFFGTPRRTLSPHTSTLGFHEITIFRIRNPDEESLANSFLPGGAEDEDAYDPSATLPSTSSTGSGKIMEKTEPTAAMLHAIMAVVYASPNDTLEAVRDSNVLGYVYIAEVDEKKKRVRVLAPLAGKLGDRPLVWGSFPEAAVSLI
jgi:polyribonucleotide 5'-hydroxyl-kinase